MTYEAFRARTNADMKKPNLRQSLGMLGMGAPMMRAAAVAAVPNYADHQAYAIAMKDHVLANLGGYLAQFEKAAKKAGAVVHWCETGADLNATVADILKSHDCRRIIKGKSMVTEEAGLNAHLEDNGYHIRETDLGEYIIQLAHETPSHIIGPAIHKTPAEVRDLFLREHDLGKRNIDRPADLVAESRAVVRHDFLEADAGIIGANALIAETGSTMLVTNEGNGDLCSTLPRVQIIVTSIEKVVPTLADATALLRLLVRNATGQANTCYTSFFTGPKREGDADGPEHVHIVLLDNGRSGLLGGRYQPMLRCIKCSACLNHCPIYTTVGGHSYDSVYPGPMGSVLTPLLKGLDGDTAALPNACTACGRCAEVCPMGIPLPDLLRELRAEEHESGLDGASIRFLSGFYMKLARMPRLFQLAARFGARFMPRRILGKPAPKPSGKTFMEQWSGK